MTSLISSAVDFCHDGTDRRYGRAEEEIPFPGACIRTMARVQIRVLKKANNQCQNPTRALRSGTDRKDLFSGKNDSVILLLEPFHRVRRGKTMLLADLRLHASPLGDAIAGTLHHDVKVHSIDT